MTDPLDELELLRTATEQARVRVTACRACGSPGTTERTGVVLCAWCAARVDDGWYVWLSRDGRSVSTASEPQEVDA